MESPKSMMMLGQIQGVDIMILVDSGSSHTFIKEAVAEKL
jgi:predicted aspartyl protease